METLNRHVKTPISRPQRWKLLIWRGLPKQTWQKPVEKVGHVSKVWLWAVLWQRKTALRTWQASVKRGGWREKKHIDISDIRLFSSHKVGGHESDKSCGNKQSIYIYVPLSIIHSAYVERVEPRVSSVNNSSAKKTTRGRAAAFFQLTPCHWGRQLGSPLVIACITSAIAVSVWMWQLFWV